MQNRYALIDFPDTYEMIAEEHKALKERLTQLQQEIRAGQSADRPQALSASAKQDYERFMSEMTAYALREEKHILPVVGHNAAFGRNSAFVLEHNFELAIHYYRTYTDVLRGGGTDRSADAEPAALHNAAQSLRHIAKYFVLEEQFVFPVSEKVMDTLAYNSQ